MKSVVFAAANWRPGDLVDDRVNAGRFRASRLSENLCVDLFSECLAALQRCGVVRNLVGHGIGRRLHEPPQVPNFAVTESRRDRLRPGMTICIEPMVTFGHYDVESLDDGWTEVTRDRSLAAHYEHTIAITDAGPPEVLSLPDDL